MIGVFQVQPGLEIVVLEDFFVANKDVSVRLVETSVLIEVVGLPGTASFTRAEVPCLLAILFLDQRVCSLRLGNVSGETIY
jgi:hypothetical protein